MQNGNSLHQYNGQPVAIHDPTTGVQYFDMETKDVKVEAGALDIDINFNAHHIYSGRSRYHNEDSHYFQQQLLPFQLSPPATSQLSDDYVTIQFPPVPENMLLGIEYSPAV